GHGGGLAESAPTVAYPCLVRGQKAFSLPDQKLHQNISMPELSGNAFFATPQGWILVVLGSGSDRSSPRETYLLHPQSRSRLDLPPLEDEHDELPERGRCLLSGNDPGGPGCSVRIFDLQSPALWFCRVSGPRWSNHVYDIGSYDLPEEYCPVPKRSGTSSTSPPLAGAVPSLDDDLYGDRQRSCIVASHLLESCGDLYLATVTFHDFCFDLPGTVRVYRMYFSVLAFRRTDDIGDRAFLLGASNFGASCSASDHGLKANCLYWVNRFSEDHGNLHVYNVKDGSLEIIQTFGSASTGQKPFWILPAAT
uniref:KIB1-4 beta-propeller domain-containing protein n=2 Tax=Setaria italica TaxID=4555 RepID=K4A3F2_SETIT